LPKRTPTYVSETAVSSSFSVACAIVWKKISFRNDAFDREAARICFQSEIGSLGFVTEKIVCIYPHFYLKYDEKKP